MDMAKGIKGSGPTEDKPIRTTFLIRPSLISKLKFIAFKDGTSQTAIIDKQLSEYVEKWEKKHGEAKLK